MLRRERGLIRLAAFRRGALARGVALLGVLGLLLQLALPLFHAPAALAVSSPAGIAWLGAAICGGADHSLPRQEGSPAAPAKPGLCPLCLALAMGGAVLLPSLAALLLGSAAVLVAGRLPALRARVLWLGLSALPRAPPVTA